MTCWALKVDWNAFGAMLSGIGTIALAYLGWLGIGAWRDQLLGSRNISLRDDLLTQAYEIEEICRYMLSPFSTSEEHAKVERKPEESDDEFGRRAAYSVVQLRFNEHLEPFSRMRALAFRAKATFGEEVYRAIGALISKPRSFILLAHQTHRAEARINKYEQGMKLGVRYDEAVVEAAAKAYQEAYSRFWGLEEGKEPIREVESCVVELERLLGDSPQPKGWLSSFWRRG